MTAPSEYVLKPLREGTDFTLYRGRQHRNPAPVLAIALTAEHPLPESLRRLEDETKTESSTAKLPLDPAIVAVLQAWRQHAPFAADSDYVFASPVMLGKKPLSSNSAQRDYLRPASIEAGLQPIGWHALRHYLAFLTMSCKSARARFPGCLLEAV
jgi:hypothetical protein